MSPEPEPWQGSKGRTSFDDCLRTSKRKQRVDISFEEAASMLQSRIRQETPRPGLLSSMSAVAVRSDECARTSRRANHLLAEYMKRRRTVLSARVASASSVEPPVPKRDFRASNGGGSWSWSRQIQSGKEARSLIEHLSLEGPTNCYY
ncbi:hypothetical protein Ciccas_003849 [Cichlidogyrus casuarinus]|uniref:Uncharacterized protein n=1 Tax=Cichlidogyrus casuarinus TaxID=1844966 RepID=A0ABD2QD67_9PLAT